MAIELHEYDPRWSAIGEAACAELIRALPKVFMAIEHIGSTSVPGLAAKPVIDLMAAADLAAVITNEAVLEELRYWRHDTGMPNRLFYRREQGGRRTHNLHVVPIASWPVRNERLLRDYLRSHPEEAARYAAIKRELSTRHVRSAEYTRAKTRLIQELTNLARAERGLPSAPVWEE